MRNICCLPNSWDGEMTEKVQLPVPGWQFIVNGIPASGYKVFVYDAGTTTKATTWTAEDGLTPNTNPAIADAEGRVNMWVPPLDSVSIEPIAPGPRGPIGPSGRPGPPGATGNAAEFSTTVDIPSETIYNGMFGEYVELVPAPDAGTILIPTQVIIGYKYQVGPYATNSANFVVNWGPPIVPVPVTNFTFSAALLENVTDNTLDLHATSGVTIFNADAIGKNLTLTLSVAPGGANLIAIAVADGGTGYAAGDTGTIDGGDGLATYEVLTETGGVVDTISLTAGGLGYSSESATTTATGGGQPGTGTDR